MSLFLAVLLTALIIVATIFVILAAISLADGDSFGEALLWALKVTGIMAGILLAVSPSLWGIMSLLTLIWSGVS